MSKIVDFHPSVLIAYSEKKNKLLTSVYDGGYPHEPFRFSANLMGGNPNKKDASPLEVLCRELAEEINLNGSINEDGSKDKEYAGIKDLELIRKALLTDIKPYADFYFHGFHFRKGPSTEYDAIFSTYFVNLPEDVIECVERNLKDRKKIVSEGLVGTFTLDILEKRGEYGTAHATAPILNKRFSTHIPYPEGVRAEMLPLPRNSFKEYLSDPELCYKPTWLKE